MVKKKKNKGASLIIVVIITSIILSLGIAMLSMSLMGYKARISESRKLQNLYESDSGLDIVYNIIRKTSAVAIQKAGNDVVDIVDEDLRNKLFKQKFLTYLTMGSSDMSSLDVYIDQWKYPEYNADGILEAKDIDTERVLDSVSIDSTHQFDEKRLNVTAQTTFSSKTGQFPNTKTIEAKFVIDAPDYNEVIVNKGISIKINPVYDGKIITADGDLKCSGNLSVDGNIWVKGSDNALDSYSYDKYKGGITLDEGTFDFKNESELYTSKTLNLQNNATANVEGSIYSSNTYLGDTVKGALSKNTILNVDNGEVVTNNDLALNSNGGLATINKYYGINDKNVDDITATPSLAAIDSSCIIVNNNNSTLRIKNEAYIMGLAFIDVNDSKKFETGESVAVKGNYVAYTDPSTDKDVMLKYYNPLQLIEKIDGQDFDTEKKIKHFISYYNSGNSYKGNGIELPKNIYSAGAVVDKSSVRKENTIEDADVYDNINKKRDYYSKNVLSMGYTGDEFGTVESIYDTGKAARTVGSQIDFNEINAYDNDRLNHKYGKVILNNSSDDIVVENKKVSILKDGIKVSLMEFENENMKGMIVTKGKVTVKSGVKFTGNIITKGDVIVEGSVNLTYDESVTRRIHASNKAYFDKVFIRPSDKKDHLDLLEKQAGELSDYYEKDFIKKGTWKVVK